MQQSSYLSGGQFNFSEYHTYEDIVAWLGDISSEYSTLVEKIVLGKTFEGRDLVAIRIHGKNATAPKFWMDSLIHSREWITGATVVYMANELITKYGSDSEITALVDSMDFYFLPVFNADGYDAYIEK